MKNILLYFALFLLIILLLLPPALRLFGKNLYNEKKFPKKNEEVLEILNCTKINETINMSFLNGKAYNIKYEITGNHLPLESNEEDSLSNGENDETEVQENQIIDDFKDYAEVSFVEEKNLTEYRIALNLYDVIPEKLLNHTKSIDEVSSYYTGLSFSCTKQKY